MSHQLVTASCTDGSGLMRCNWLALLEQAPMVNVGNEEPAAIVTKLRQALDAVSRLSSERAAIEEALKVRA